MKNNKAEENKVATATNQNVMAIFAGEDLKDFRGAVNVRDEINRPPMIKLGQAMSPDVKAGLVKNGEFFCKTKNAVYGESITILPLAINESAAYLDRKGKLICRSANLIKSTDGHSCRECPYQVNGYSCYWNNWEEKGGEQGTKPYCAASIDVVCLVKTEEGIDPIPSVFQFRKSSHKAGKDFVRNVNAHKSGIPFENWYTLSSITGDQDSRKVAQTFVPTPITAEEFASVKEIARKVIRQLKDGLIQVITEEDEDLIETEASDDLPI